MDMLQLLLALRAQHVAAVATIDAALSAMAPVAPDPDTGCRHPPEKRVNTTVNGGPKRFMCIVCEGEFEIQ